MSDTGTKARRHSCRGVIEKSLQENPGILKVSVDRENRKLLLDYDPEKIEASAAESIAKEMTPELDHVVECPLWVARDGEQLCEACLSMELKSKDQNDSSALSIAPDDSLKGNTATIEDGNLTLFLPPSPHTRLRDLMAGSESLTIDFGPKKKRGPWGRFWNWYNNNLMENTIVAAVLFTWQLVHLYWLTADVVMTRLIGRSFFQLTGVWHTIITLVDFTEIPAIFAISLVYVNELRKKFNWKSLWFLFFLNTQWLHIFWITDEFVVERFTGEAMVIFPVWLAWVAIGIDYLELPVIYDTLKKATVMILEKAGVKKKKKEEAAAAKQ